MSQKRTQRYRLTTEFVLRDRKEYAKVRTDIFEILKGWERMGLIQIDYIAVEKCEDVQNHKI